MKTFQKN